MKRGENERRKINKIIYSSIKVTNHLRRWRLEFQAHIFTRKRQREREKKKENKIT